MRRILVIGCGGAGKSTFATKLGARLSLPVIHLDAHYWRPGWVEPTPAEWTQAVESLTRGEAWIMDGNYGGTLDRRLAACDAAIFLDVPRWRCLWRVVRRRLEFAGRARPDVAAGCTERLTWDFLGWIWTYRAVRRPPLLARLAALPDRKQVFVIRNRRDMDAFLARAEARPARPG